MRNRKRAEEVRVDMDHGFYTRSRDLAMWLARTTLSGSQLAIVGCIEACCYGWTNSAGDHSEKWKNKYEAAQIPHSVFETFTGLSAVSVSASLRDLVGHHVVLRDRDYRPALYAINPVVSLWDGSILRTGYKRKLSEWISVKRSDNKDPDEKDYSEKVDSDKSNGYEKDLSNQISVIQMDKWLSNQISGLMRSDNKDLSNQISNSGVTDSGKSELRPPNEVQRSKEQHVHAGTDNHRLTTQEIHKAVRILGGGSTQKGNLRLVTLQSDHGADLVCDAWRCVERIIAGKDNPYAYLVSCIEGKWWETPKTKNKVPGKPDESWWFEESEGMKKFRAEQAALQEGKE